MRDKEHRDMLIGQQVYIGDPEDDHRATIAKVEIDDRGSYVALLIDEDGVFRQMRLGGELQMVGWEAAG